MTLKDNVKLNTISEGIMEKYRVVDKRILVGYQYSEQKNTIKACDEWLSAWDDIKLIMEETGINDINKLQKKYQWSDFLSNFVQDLEEELLRAGYKDKKYYNKRIKYCYELLEGCIISNDLIIENTRRAIAESYFLLDNRQECDRLFDMWLHNNPDWGWGYIGWADCYFFCVERETTDLEKARSILEKALSRKILRDRIYVEERITDIYKELNNQK